MPETHTRVTLYNRYGNKSEYGNSSAKEPAEILLVAAPRFPKFVTRLFSSPISTNVLNDISDELLVASTESLVVIFTRVHSGKNRDLYAGISIPCLGEAVQSIVKIMIPIVGVAVIGALFGGPVLGNLLLLPLLPFIFRNASNSDFIGLTVKNDRNYLTPEKISSFSRDHPLLKFSWEKMCYLGATHFIGKTPFRVSYKELLTGKLSVLTWLRDFLGIRSTIPTRTDSDASLSADKTKFTIYSAYSDEADKTLALIAIPDSNPDGGILILPEPRDMEKAIEVIRTHIEKEISLSNEAKASTELHNIKTEERTTSTVTSTTKRTELTDPATQELINQEMPKLSKYKRPEVETTLVEFYEKFDECLSDQAKNARATIIEITKDDPTITDGARRTLMGYLYERETRLILYKEYDILRSSEPLLHPKQTLEKLRKKHPEKYNHAFKKAVYLLCLRSHYRDFFQEAEELRKTKQLNYNLTARAVKNSSPEKYLFTPEVYAYHLRERIRNPSSWQAAV